MGYLIQSGTGTVNLNLALAMGNTAPQEDLGPVQEVYAESFGGGTNGIGAGLQSILDSLASTFAGSQAVSSLRFAWPSNSDVFQVGISQMYGYGQFAIDDTSSSFRLVFAGPAWNGNELLYFNTSNGHVQANNLYLYSYDYCETELGAWFKTFGDVVSHSADDFDSHGAAQSVADSLPGFGSNTDFSSSGYPTLYDLFLTNWGDGSMGISSLLSVLPQNWGQQTYSCTYMYLDGNYTIQYGGYTDGSFFETGGHLKANAFGSPPITIGGGTYGSDLGFDASGNLTAGNATLGNLTLQNQGGLMWMNTTAGVVWCDANILPNGSGWLRFIGGASGIEFDDSSNGISLGASSRLNMAAGGQYSYGRLALPDISHQSTVDQSLVANTAWATLDETNSNLVFSVLLSDGQTVKHGTVALS